MATATLSTGLQSLHDSIFASVFPPKDFTTPTPEATPNIGVLASPARSFGDFNTSTSADEVIRLSRAWSTATRALTSSFLKETALQKQSISPDVRDAFELLCRSPTTRKELLAWYENDVAVRFRHQVLPDLQAWLQPVPLNEAAGLLGKTVEVLAGTQRHLLSVIVELESRASDAETHANLVGFRNAVKRKLQVLLLNSLPSARLQNTMAHSFYQQMSASLSESKDFERCSKPGECQCLPILDTPALAQLQDVGLGDSLGERALAHAMHKLLRSVVGTRQCFQVDWSGHSTIIPKLRRWVQIHFAPFVERSLAALTGNASLRLSNTDVKPFMEMAVTNLGRQRTASLFDYVKSWPDSKGAVMDIREYLTSSAAAEKAHVCSSFVRQVQHRLLHAGATTTEILGMYVSVIYAFKALDARGVLLEKVAVPIRSYLRAREDTVNIIAASFLADLDKEGNVIYDDQEKICADLTVEIANSTLDDGRDHRMLNWDDMDWTPDPIDAGPDYRASRSEDILAYVLNLFDQEDFINEVRNVLAQHLLRAEDPEYVKETRLVELLKARLDANKLQAAEVMLKDARDSVVLNKRINPQARYVSARPPTPREIQAAIPEEGITLQSLYRMFEHRIKQAQFQAALKLVATRRHDLFYPKRTRLPPEKANDAEMGDGASADFKVQVLSGHFWPQMRSSEFQLPAQFVELASKFNARFNLQGSQRKLHWRSALTRTTVELELEDRHVKEVDVQAWQASVIDAFSAERDVESGMAPLQYDAEIGLNADQLAEALKMEEELVQDALNFWITKRVLYQTAPGTYAVLERLDMDAGIAQPLAPPPTDQVSAVMSHEALLRESAPMFETFIANMLRNGGPKEVGGMMGITGMLKMVLPTFTYGDEEVEWLLSDMEGKGEVARSGELWKVAG